MEITKPTYFKTKRYLCWCFAVSPVSGHWSIFCAESSFRFYKYEKIVTMTLIFKALSLSNGNLLSPLQRGEADWLLDIHCLQGHQGHSAYLTQARPTLAYVPSTGRVSTSPPLYRYALRTAVELAVALNAVNLATPLPQISSLRLAPFDLSSFPPLGFVFITTDSCSTQTYVEETLRSICLYSWECRQCSLCHMFSKHRTRFNMETSVWGHRGSSQSCLHAAGIFLQTRSGDWSCSPSG